MNNILDVKVSFYTKFTTKKPVELNLYMLLTNQGYRDKVDAIRSESDPEKQKQMKNTLPLFTPSGIFSGANAASLTKPSGLICIDIDKKDNEDVADLNSLKEKIKNVPYIAYCGQSVRGEGYFCIIPIAMPEKHKQHFLSLEMDFARCGIVIDKACSDISRKRFVSYDPAPYLNPNAEVYDRIVEPQRRADKTAMSIIDSSSAAVEVARLISLISKEQKDITGGYSQWFEIACSLANEFGENGREMFHAISQYGNSYDSTIADNKYSEALKGNYSYTIGTLFHYAGEAGLRPQIHSFPDLTKKI